MSSNSYRCKQTVAVAMSGGIDSAATALILKTKGFNVIGVFVKSWDVNDEGGKSSNCTYDSDKEDMQQVCKRLGVDHFEVVDRINIYKPY
jgi:tRNA-specific 2-thiouridylase